MIAKELKKMLQVVQGGGMMGRWRGLLRLLEVEGVTYSGGYSRWREFLILRGAERLLIQGGVSFSEGLRGLLIQGLLIVEGASRGGGGYSFRGCS